MPLLHRIARKHHAAIAFTLDGVAREGRSVTFAATGAHRRGLDSLESYVNDSHNAQRELAAAGADPDSAAHRSPKIFRMV